MPNRKTARTTPKVIDGSISYPTETPIGTFYHTVAVGSVDWFNWLHEASVFSYTAHGVTFTVRQEHRQRGGGYWVAYKKVEGNLHKRYIGTPDHVTTAALDSTAEQFRAAQVPQHPTPAQPPEADQKIIDIYQPLIDTMQPLNDATAAARFDDWRDLPDVLARLGKLYLERHGYDWTLTAATIRVEGRSCYLDTKRGDHIYFQDKEKAQRFLAGYVASGKPTFALVRQQ